MSVSGKTDQVPPDAVVTRARLGFAEQVRFFRRKLNLPTEHWRSIERAAHDRAFVVAGAMKADLLADLRKAVDESVRGGSLEKFRQNFRDIVARHGWTGWTGEDSQEGQAWRTRVIYQTNVATSYAAGRWAQLHDPDLLKHRPYWRYVHSGALHAREQHKAWGNMRLTLRYDHPFWQTHFPPNGWGCWCRVEAVEGIEAGDATAPPVGWNAIDPRTGSPAGIDRGWDYAPGARADNELRSFVQDKLVTYPPAIEKALSAEIKKHLIATQRVEDFVRQVLADQQTEETLWLGFVESPVARIKALTGIDVRGYTLLLPAQQILHIRSSHGFDGGSQRPPEPADYVHAFKVLDELDSIELSPDTGPNGEPRLKVAKRVNGETFVMIFEVRPGKRNRAVALFSFWIKTS